MQRGSGADESSQFDLRLFGCWDLRVDGRAVELGGREQRLLALLALRGRRSRSYVAGTLWPDTTENRAQTSLRTAVLRSRRVVDGILDAGRTTVALAPGVRVDVHEMLRVAEPRHAAVSDPDAITAMMAAGDLLPGWYDDWVIFERERLQHVRLRALESLAELELAYLYLDAIALRVRMGQRVVSVPVLVALGVLADGSKQLLAMEMCTSESRDAWRGFLESLTARGLVAPKVCVVDGNPGLRGAIERSWPKTLVQRCTVHKLRNLLRKAPAHALEAIKADYHRIVYAASLAEARKAWAAFVRKWKKTCPGVVASLEEGGDELLTFFAFPAEQWKCLRTTNAIERLNEEFRRRVKTQGSFPAEDAAMVLLYGLVATGQIKLRKIDGPHLVRAVLAKTLALDRAA